MTLQFFFIILVNLSLQFPKTHDSGVNDLIFKTMQIARLENCLSLREWTFWSIFKQLLKVSIINYRKGLVLLSYSYGFHVQR